MRANELIEIINRASNEWSGDLKIMATQGIIHPLMGYMLKNLKAMSIVDSDSLNMQKVYEHLTFLKSEYERENDTRHPDVAMIYTHAECCGHTIVIKKGTDEIRIRYNKRPLVDFSL